MAQGHPVSEITAGNRMRIYFNLILYIIVLIVFITTEATPLLKNCV
jgi:hypothetical protein